MSPFSTSNFNNLCAKDVYLRKCNVQYTRHNKFYNSNSYIQEEDDKDEMGTKRAKMWIIHNSTHAQICKTKNL